MEIFGEPWSIGDVQGENGVGEIFTESGALVIGIIPVHWDIRGKELLSASSVTIFLPGKVIAMSERVAEICEGAVCHPDPSLLSIPSRHAFGDIGVIDLSLVGNSE